MMKWFLLVALLAALGVVVADSIDGNPIPVSDPTFFAYPPYGVPYQPMFLGIWNSTNRDIFINGDVWWVEDSADQRVAEASFRFAAFWPVPPLVLIPGAWYAEYADIYTAYGRWHEEPAPGSYEERIDSLDVVILDGGMGWEANPNPVVEGTQIALSLTNGTATTKWVKNTNPWEIKDEDGNHVYTPGAFQGYTAIPPGSSQGWNYDLVYDDLTPIPPGNYVAEVEIFANSGDVDGELLREPFTVMADPGGAVVWKVTPMVQSVQSAVALTLTNATQDTVCLNCYGPWWIEDAMGEEVYYPPSCQAINYVHPGESRVWGWDERDNSGESVPAGLYAARIQYSICSGTPGAPTDTSTFWFELVDVPNVDPGVCWFLETDNAVYLPGEQVHFTFVNCAPDTTINPYQDGWWVGNAFGIPVFAEIGLPAHQVMPPGYTFNDSWDQTRNIPANLPPDQAPLGIYYIYTSFWDKVQATYYIVKSNPFVLGATTGTGDGDPDAMATALRLSRNPMTDATTLLFTVPQGGEPVALRVFDTTGRTVATDDLGFRTAGDHAFVWDSVDASGRRLPAGVYFVQLRVGEKSLIRKVSILR